MSGIRSLPDRPTREKALLSRDGWFNGGPRHEAAADQTQGKFRATPGGRSAAAQRPSQSNGGRQGPRKYSAQGHASRNGVPHQRLAPVSRVVQGMKPLPDKMISPLRRQAADVLRRARQLPVGHARNDLRQLAVGLLWLEKRGFVAVPEDREVFARQRKNEGRSVGDRDTSQR
jgi:hypothetical protein